MVISAASCGYIRLGSSLTGLFLCTSPEDPPGAFRAQMLSEIFRCCLSGTLTLCSSICDVVNDWGALWGFWVRLQKGSKRWLLLPRACGNVRFVCLLVCVSGSPAGTGAVIGGSPRAWLRLFGRIDSVIPGWVLQVSVWADPHTTCYSP